MATMVGDCTKWSPENKAILRRQRPPSRKAAARL